MHSTGEARHDTGSVPVAAQGLLFTDDLPELREDTGYRGPTACNAAGITYRQLAYWSEFGRRHWRNHRLADCCWRLYLHSQGCRQLDGAEERYQGFHR